MHNAHVHLCIVVLDVLEDDVVGLALVTQDPEVGFFDQNRVAVVNRESETGTDGDYEGSADGIFLVVVEFPEDSVGKFLVMVGNALVVGIFGGLGEVCRQWCPGCSHFWDGLALVFGFDLAKTVFDQVPICPFPVTVEVQLAQDVGRTVVGAGLQAGAGGPDPVQAFFPEKSGRIASGFLVRMGKVYELLG